MNLVKSSSSSSLSLSFIVVIQNPSSGRLAGLTGLAGLEGLARLAGLATPGRHRCLYGAGIVCCSGAAVGSGSAIGSGIGAGVGAAAAAVAAVAAALPIDRKKAFEKCVTHYLKAGKSGRLTGHA
eukprot:3623765-Karenia_brevis.AAC.1